MEYAKLENGKLTKFGIFPNGMCVLNGRFKKNPTHEEILSAGYLPIEETTEPQNKEGFVKSSRWVQTDTAIIKKWTVLPDRRPMTQDAVSKMIIAQQINTLAVDDNTALRMKSFYPTWAENTAYAVGHKVQYDGELYKCIQAHTAIVTWEPVNTASLWVKINETHGGTLEDPIPYNGNMVLENGKHYVQNSIIYLCNRDTVNPVYHALSELVGLYVVEV